MKWSAEGKNMEITEIHNELLKHWKGKVEKDKMCAWNVNIFRNHVVIVLYWYKMCKQGYNYSDP